MDIFSILLSLGQLVFIVWGLVELVTTVWPCLNKEITAALTGMLVTLAVVMLGYVQIDPPGRTFHTWERVLAAMTLGLFTVAGSYILNNKILNPFKHAWKGGGS